MSLADAMAKAGLISEKDAEKVRKENVLKGMKQTNKFGEDKEKTQKERDERDKSFKSTQNSKFTKLFNNEKSRKFVEHLLHAFLPVKKGQFVFDWKGQGIKKKNCDICRRETLSKIGAIKVSQEAIDASMGEGKSIFEMFERHAEVFKNRKLAVFSPESRTIFCAPCWKDFLNWAIIESVYSGNRLVMRVMEKQTRAYWQDLFSQPDTSVDDYLNKEISKLEKEVDS